MIWPKYYNIDKQSNQGTMWKRHVCVTEIYQYAKTNTCTLLLVIHVRWYDSSTYDIQFLRINYSPCIKKSSLLKFRKAGFIMKRLILIHWIHYKAWLTWLTAIFIRALHWYAVSIHRKQLIKSYCSWNDRITVNKWHMSFPVRKNTNNSVKILLSNENWQQKT